MNIDVLLLGVSAAASIFGKSSIDDTKLQFNAKVANYVTNKAEELYSQQLQEARQEVFAAKTKLGEFSTAENAELESKLFNDPVYIQAKADMETAKATMQANEAILKNAKEDSTAIAVGNGDSAIKIKVSNETAKAKATADLKAAKADYKIKCDTVERIKRVKKADIISKRTPEYYQASSKLQAANKNLSDIQDRVSATKEELYNNPDVMRAAAQSAGPINMGKVVGLACLESTLPCWMLYKIWHNVYEFACLKDFYKG